MYCECDKYWKGEACDIPYCKANCGSPDHGYCDLTGEKLCVFNDSWQGKHAARNGAGLAGDGARDWRGDGAGMGLRMARGWCGVGLVWCGIAQGWRGVGAGMALGWHVGS